MRHIRLAVEHRHDLFNVCIQQHIVVGFFLKQRTGVDELRGGVGFVFGQYQNRHGDGGAIKQVGREGNDGFDVVVIHEVLADFLFSTATVKDAGKANNRGASFAGQVAERVQHKGKVGLGFGGKHARWGKAIVVDERGVVATYPLHRIRRIGDDGVKRFFIAKAWINKGVTKLDIEFVVVDVVQEHVHARQVIRGVVQFLPPKTVFNQMLVKVFLACSNSEPEPQAGRKFC